MIRVKVPSTRKSAIGVTETDIAETDIGDVDTASVSAIDVAINITKAMNQTAFTLQKLLDAFQGIEPALTALISAVADAGAVDDSVKDKARRWDEMQRLFAK